MNLRAHLPATWVRSTNTAGAPTPPEGYGAEPQEAIIRDLISDELTDSTDREIISEEGREKIKKHILEAIHKHTDVHVEEILFPDFTVQ